MEYLIFIDRLKFRRLWLHLLLGLLRKVTMVDHMLLHQIDGLHILIVYLPISSIKYLLRSRSLEWSKIVKYVIFICIIPSNHCAPSKLYWGSSNGSLTSVQLLNLRLQKTFFHDF
jgi:hypothetical protein